MGKPVIRIWPDSPAKLDPGCIELVLHHLPVGTSRGEAKSTARAILREILCRLLPDATLIETPRGPVTSRGDIRISLSYANDKILIGLTVGRALGVDIVAIERLPEIETLSCLYLPKLDFLAIQGATTQLRDSAFALAWAKMEASCKCLDLPLTEIDARREYAYDTCQIIDCDQIDDYQIAVAIER